MFNTYLYKTVPLAGIQRNQAVTNVLVIFYLWLRMYTFV